MIPSRRQRAAGALAAGLAGVVIAVVLLRQQPDEVMLEGANATTRPPVHERALAPPPRTAADERLAAAQREPSAAADDTTTTDPSGNDSAASQGAVDESERSAVDQAAADSVPLDAKPEAKRPTGSVDRQAIKDAMTRMKPLIRACYEEGLKQDPSLAGRVVVEFEISGEEGKGVVKQGSVVESEAASPFFEACVLQKVSGLDAPAPEGGGVVKVRYPFLFDPGGGFGGEPPASDDGETP